MPEPTVLCLGALGAAALTVMFGGGSGAVKLSFLKFTKEAGDAGYFFGTVRVFQLIGLQV